MKKIISIILCVSLCMSMCITTALGAAEAKGFKTAWEYKAVMSGIDGFINNNGLAKYVDAEGNVLSSAPSPVPYYCGLNGAYEADGKSIKVPENTELSYRLNQSSNSTWPIGETRYIEYKFDFNPIAGTKDSYVLVEFFGPYCEMRNLKAENNYVRAVITKTDKSTYSTEFYGSGSIKVPGTSSSSGKTTFKGGDFYVTEVNMGVATEKISTGTTQYTQILTGLDKLSKVDGKNHYQAAFDASGNIIEYSTDNKTNVWINVGGSLADSKIELVNYNGSYANCISTYNFPSNAQVGDVYKLKLVIDVTEQVSGSYLEFSIGGLKSKYYYEVKNITVGEHTIELIAEMTSSGYNCTLAYDGANKTASSWTSYTSNFVRNNGVKAYLKDIEIGVEKELAPKGAVSAPVSESGRARVEICQTQTDTLAEAVLISAIYTADNELVGLNTYELPLDEKADNKYYEYWCIATPEKAEDNLVYKAFLWNSVSGLTPIPASN